MTTLWVVRACPARAAARGKSLLLRHKRDFEKSESLLFFAPFFEAGFEQGIYNDMKQNGSKASTMRFGAVSAYLFIF